MTLEGWVELMYVVWRGIGATGPWFSIPYFLLLVAVGHFFVLNLVLAVIFDNFDSIADAERAAKGQSELMEAATSEGREKSEQREAKRKRSVHLSIDRCPGFRLRKLVDSRNWLTTVALILLNAVALALHYYALPDRRRLRTTPVLYVHTLEIISHVFTALSGWCCESGRARPLGSSWGRAAAGTPSTSSSICSLLDLALMTYTTARTTRARRTSRATLFGCSARCACCG